MKALSSHLAVCVYNPHGDSSGAKRSEWEKGGERERERRGAVKMRYGGLEKVTGGQGRGAAVIWALRRPLELQQHTD